MQSCSLWSNEDEKGSVALGCQFLPKSLSRTAALLWSRKCKERDFLSFSSREAIATEATFCINQVHSWKSHQLQRGAPASLRGWCPSTLCHVFSWVHEIPGAGAAIWAACSLAVTDAKNTTEIPQVHFQVHYRWCAQSSVLTFSFWEWSLANGFIKTASSLVD